MRPRVRSGIVVGPTHWTHPRRTHPDDLTDSSCPADLRNDPQRIVGVTAIALATSLLVQDVVVAGAGAPEYGAPITDVLAFHAQNRGPVAVAVGLGPNPQPAAAAGVPGWSSRPGPAQRQGRVVVSLRPGRGCDAVGHLGDLCGGVDRGRPVRRRRAQPSPTLELAWQLHAAGLAMALPALGTTFLGAAMATHAASLTPRGAARLLGVVGAAPARRRRGGRPWPSRTAPPMVFVRWPASRCGSCGCSRRAFGCSSHAGPLRAPALGECREHQSSCSSRRA